MTAESCKIMPGSNNFALFFLFLTNDTFQQDSAFHNTLTYSEHIKAQTVQGDRFEAEK